MSLGQVAVDAKSNEITAIPALLDLLELQGALVTIDALVHWHIVNDGLYRQLLGQGLDDPDVARRVREHITTVALRTLGLE